MKTKKTREKRKKTVTRKSNLHKRGASARKRDVTVTLSYSSDRFGLQRVSAAKGDDGDGDAVHQGQGCEHGQCQCACHRPTPFVLIPPDPEDGARIIRITGEVDEDMMENVSREINRYNRASDTAPILAIICSGGGDAYAGLGIYDAFKTSIAHRSSP